MVLPHSAVGWYVVCDCGIFSSYSPIFCDFFYVFAYFWNDLAKVFGIRHFEVKEL